MTLLTVVLIGTYGKQMRFAACCNITMIALVSEACWWLG
jgi:hypothetical protein